MRVSVPFAPRLTRRCHLLTSTAGATLTEYGLLLGLVGAVAVGAIFYTGIEVKNSLDGANTELADARIGTGGGGSTGPVASTPVDEDPDSCYLDEAGNATLAFGEGDGYTCFDLQEGTDSITTAVPDGVRIMAARGWKTITTDAGDDTITVTGPAHSDARPVSANAAPYLIQSGAGNDTITLSGGTTLGVNGGEGDDTISITGITGQSRGVWEMEGSYIEQDAWNENIRFMERVTGGPGADTISLGCTPALATQTVRGVVDLDQNDTLLVDNCLVLPKFASHDGAVLEARINDGGISSPQALHQATISGRVNQPTSLYTYVNSTGEAPTLDADLALDTAMFDASNPWSKPVNLSWQHAFQEAAPTGPAPQVRLRAMGPIPHSNAHQTYASVGLAYQTADARIDTGNVPTTVSLSLPPPERIQAHHDFPQLSGDSIELVLDLMRVPATPTCWTIRITRTDGNTQDLSWDCNPSYMGMPAYYITGNTQQWSHLDVMAEGYPTRRLELSGASIRTLGIAHNALFE